MPAELACKRSHALMYEKAKEEFKWALIVEDDVEFDTNKLGALWQLVEQFDRKSPIIISCYLGKWSVVRSSKEFEGALECLYPPDGTLCYFINSAAIKVAAQSFDPVRPADWPIWSKDVDFLVFPGIAHEIETSVSLIDPLKTRVKAQRTISGKVWEFFGAAYFRYLGFRWETIKNIWYWVYRQRIIWYFPCLVNAKRS